MTHAGPALLDSLREAVRSLSRARLRTLLGLVGIAIGIASVIAMVSAGEIATAEARKQFEALGTDIVTVRTAQGYRGPGIQLDDALALADSLPEISAAAPTVAAGSGFVHAGRKVGSGSMKGVTASYADLVKLELAEGRFVSDLDAENDWVVVGAKVAAAIRRAGTLDPMEAEIEIDERFYRVAGVLAKREEAYGSPVEVDADNTVLVSAVTAWRVTPRASVETIVARAAPGVHHEDAAAAAGSLVQGAGPRAQAGNHDREAADRADGVAARGDDPAAGRHRLHQPRRRRHRGDERHADLGDRAPARDRRAQGAGRRRGDIRRQFLIESVILTLAGGLVGLAVGSGATGASAATRLGVLRLDALGRRRARRLLGGRPVLRPPARPPGLAPRPHRRPPGGMNRSSGNGKPGLQPSV